MKRIKEKMDLFDLVLLGSSIVFLLVILFVFHPCGPKDDGSWMVCHWAGSVLIGLASVVVGGALLHCLPFGRGMKLGISLVLILVLILTCLVPGTLIDLCMMPGMYCRSVMRPGTIICSVLVMAVCMADIAVGFRRRKA